MPLYRWKGITVDGTFHSGQLYASQIDELKNALLQKNIALLEAYESGASIFHFFKKKQISVKEAIFFFEYMGIFLESGVDIARALTLCQSKKNNDAYQKFLVNLTHEISSGKLLSEALASHKEMISPFMVHAVSLGEQTGKLAYTFKRLAHYFQFREELRVQIRKAALLPMITLFFACVIVGGLFLFVIPQFMTFFESMNKPIPEITQKLMSVSFFLRSWNGMIFLMSVPIFAISFRSLLQLSKFKCITDRIVARFWSSLLLPDLVSFLETLELCLSSGIPLHETLSYAQHGVKNVCFQKKIGDVVTAVSYGSSLSQALIGQGSQFFPQVVIDMVALGEQTGTLSVVVVKVKHIFHTELTKKLFLAITLIQPILLIVVGIIIAGLMISLYLPIFNLVDAL